jgi:hypothetical protein
MQLAEQVSRTERLRARLMELQRALERARTQGASPDDVAVLQQALRRTRRRLREVNESAVCLPALRLAAIRPL